MVTIVPWEATAGQYRDLQLGTSGQTAQLAKQATMGPKKHDSKWALISEINFLYKYRYLCYQKLAHGRTATTIEFRLLIVLLGKDWFESYDTNESATLVQVLPYQH